MTPNEYQRAAIRTANLEADNRYKNLTMCGLGISGEAGEVTDYIKKAVFHGHELNTAKLSEELGDVCWYIAVCCEAAGLKLEDVLTANIKKLWERYPEGFTSEASIARADKNQYHYRLQRGGLAESLLTERTFPSKEEMVRDIFDDVIPTIDICYTVIGFAPYMDEPDKRICDDDWEHTTIITAAVYDPYANRIYKNNAFGFCNVKVTEREWYWYHKNTNTIRKICPDDYPGMALGGGEGMSRFAFRAWDTKENCMLEQTDIPYLSVQELFCSGRYIAMQWIGEYDKRKTPIYEGDYISYPIQAEEKLYIAAWNDQQARFEAVSVPIDKENKIAPGLNSGTTKCLKVKGNIYETSITKLKFVKPVDCEEEINTILPRPAKIVYHGYDYNKGRAAMRRLKFRVWNDVQKMMLPWEELRELSVQELFSLKGCAVIQWTGCRSSRGEPIYEGDIIVSLKDKKQEPYIVCWSRGLTGFSAKPIYPGTYIAPSIGQGSESANELVIVGNVKEHPDIARYQTLESIYGENAPPITESEYKQCPFCKSNNVELECDDGIWFIRCEDCGAQGSTAYMPGNAITMWNSWIGKGGGK